jgi:hypothetical protein
MATRGTCYQMALAFSEFGVYNLSCFQGLTLTDLQQRMKDLSNWPFTWLHARKIQAHLQGQGTPFVAPDMVVPNSQCTLKRSRSEETAVIPSSNKSVAAAAPSPLMARAAADKTFAEQLREAGLSSCDFELYNLVALASTNGIFSLDDLKALNVEEARNCVSAMLLTPVQTRKLLRKLGVLTAAPTLLPQL